MNENKTTTLYEHYKNTPKKLKIVCDWDEVIQACEPYALNLADKEFWGTEDKNWLENFWEDINDGKGVQFSPYGSQLKGFYKELTEKQQEIKNSPDFYRKAPFLTIAEDLLKLIKEDKVEKLIFLSAYDKRKFPNADYRKVNIFVKTFFKLVTSAKYEFRLELIHFDSEIRSSERTSIVGDQTQGQSKADWIKKKFSDFDLVIDDNPNICRSILNEFISFGLCRDCRKENKKDCVRCPKELSIVCSPYYPAIEKQHDERVLLLQSAKLFSTFLLSRKERY